MNRRKNKITLKLAQSLNLNVLREHMRNCHIHTHTSPYHMAEITGTLWHLYRNIPVFIIDPSGRKGSVSFGLETDISLPHCLATGIWNLVPKATSGPKSRGPSFGTTLWRHVQRYCAQFLVSMVIYGNPLLRIFCLRVNGSSYYSRYNKIYEPRMQSLQLYDLNTSTMWGTKLVSLT